MFKLICCPVKLTELKAKKLGRKPIIQDKKKFIKMWNNNVLTKDMAKTFKTSRSTISFTAKRFKLKSRKLKYSGIEIQKQIEEFTKLWNNGILQKQIAKKFKVSQSTISHMARKFGLNQRHRGGSQTQVTDQQIIDFIKEKDIVSSKELKKKFGHLSRELRKLVREEQISTFKLTLGKTAHIRGAVDLFNGFSKPSGCKYYYIDAKIAAKIMIKKLKLNQSLSRSKKTRLSLLLGRALKPDLFSIVKNSYCPDRIDSLGPVTLRTIKKEKRKKG